MGAASRRVLGCGDGARYDPKHGGASAVQPMRRSGCARWRPDRGRAGDAHDTQMVWTTRTDAVQVKTAKADKVVFTIWHGARKHVACLRTVKSLVENMITGVTKVCFRAIE